MSPISQEELTQKINQLFDHDRELAVYALKARAYENGTVQIQGIVDVLDEKRQAEELVWRIPGVKKVENNITVCTDGPVDDEDVAFEVSEELRADPEVPDSVGFRVSGGEVELMGSVNNLGEAEEAMEAAGRARGVREVRSQLKMAEAVDDATITNNVQVALLAEPELVPGRVKALTKDGVVTLWGNVSEEVALLALKVAAGVPGVKKVVNEFNHGGRDLDDRVVMRMMEKMADNPYLNQLPISIEVEEGRVSLSGRLDTLEAKRDIEEIVQEMLDEEHLPAWVIDNQLWLESQEH